MRPTLSEFVEILREAYKKIGYSPCKVLFFKPYSKECCPVGALMLARGITTEDIEWEAIDEVIGPSSFAEKWDFIRGWDGGNYHVAEDLYFYNLGKDSVKELMG